MLWAAQHSRGRSLARAQPRMPLIGVMSPLCSHHARNLAALRNGLRDLGYTESQNLKIEYRFADGDPDDLLRSCPNWSASSPPRFVGRMRPSWLRSTPQKLFL